MYIPLKKAIATFSSIAIFAISTTSVSAKTFNDVNESAWYYEYVEQLVSDGVIQSSSYFYPNTAQKREELIKWVIIATDGLKDYEEPVTPTFDDVPPSSPYYEYIEAAVQMGIVIGYTDDYGNPLAVFGPKDNVNRAAATKILVNSFQVPTRLTIKSSFPDVKENQWYHDYVMTAYNYSILDGYENGYFGPGDSVTRAQMAKLIANAKAPVKRTEHSSTSTTGATMGATTGTTTGLTAVWANDGGYKVTQGQLLGTQNSPQTNNSVWNGNKISLFGAKNETVSFNLVLEAGSSAVNNVEVEFNTLTGPAGHKIQSENRNKNNLFNWVNRPIELFYVRYLEIKGASTDLFYDHYDERHVPERMRRPWSGDGDGNGGWTDRPDANAFYPDPTVPLELESPFNIASKKNQSIWADIYIPKSARKGLYTGNVTVKENGKTTYEIPVELTVRNFTLPDLPSAKTLISYSPENICERHVGQKWPDGNKEVQCNEVINNIYKLMHRHKMSLDGGDENFGYKDQQIIDWLSGDLFTPARGYDGVGVGIGNNLYSIGTYGSWGWQGDGKQAMWDNTNRYADWFNVQNFSTPTDVFLYLIDESDDYPQIEQWASWMDQNPGSGRDIKSFATIDAFEANQHTPSLDIPAMWASFDITDKYESATNAVKNDSDRDFYLYNGGRPATGSFAIEDDGIAPRVTAWSQYKKGVDRWFYWESTYWDNFQGNTGRTNVYQQAQTFGNNSRFNNELGRTGWNYLNGDGVLLYPGTDLKFPSDNYGVKGPIASIRLKNWRRGLQDVDYLTMAAKVNPSRVNQIVQNIIPKVLWEYGVSDESDPSWIRTDISWSNDPDVWEQARKELADIIERK